jgi:phosphoglycerate dehydrogenase-like enzyme
MQARCVILDDYQDVALQIADWSALAGKIEIERLNTSLLERDQLAEPLAPYQVIVAMRERTVFDAELLARLPHLKLLVTTGMVNAAIDMEAAGRRGILVCGTRGSVGPAAELAWGLLLALARNIPAEVANLRGNGEPWQVSVGIDLKGKTLGIAGVGRLGRLVAGYGLAFGMHVIGWSRSNTPEKSHELGIGFVATLDGLLKQADVVTLHLTLTPETRGIIGARELGLMKPGALLVNSSRGPLVDEAALIAALRSGHVGGAALDVFDTEPLPVDHPFRTLPNVVATPHLGYVTRETYRIYYQGAADAVAAWLAGTPIRVLNAPTPSA